MWIELTTFPALNTPDVRRWVLRGTTPLQGPAPAAPPGMTLLETRELGAPTNDLSGRPLVAYGYQREFYKLFEGSTYIKTLNVVITTSQPIRMRIKSSLFVQAAVGQAIKDKILRLFRNYDRQRDGDAISYAFKNMPPDVTSDMFSALPSYSIEKAGAPQILDKQRQALKEFYQGQHADLIPFVEGAFQKYIKKYKLVLASTEDSEPPAPQPPNPRHVEGDPDHPDPIIDNVINWDARGMTCDPNRTEKERIMAVLWWPEYEMRSEDVEIDLGCGVRGIITVPVLYYRDGRQAVWAALAHPVEFDQLLVRQLVDCLIRASLAAAVVGTIAWDFEAALAAFGAVFDTQLKIYIVHDVECIIPELFLIEEHGQWNRV